MTLKEARLTLRPYGIRVDKTEHDEYRVAYARDNDEASAYYASDLCDAIETGLCMANFAMHKRS